nr:polyadenylate-binding protein 2-like isoform X2 [Ipomoea batatas]
MEPHNTDDDAVKELDEMEKRLKEMEEEAGGVLREMQAKVEKEMGAVQNPASDAASFSGKQGGRVWCFIAETVVRADIIEPRYCGCTTKSTVEGGPTPHQGSLAGGGSNKVIFAYKKRAALIANFLSLQFETDVRVAMIECWCCVLNEKEKYKRAYNPSRFFVSALTSIHTIVFATASRERRLRWFVKRLDGNFDIAPHINRCTVDLFFFPMSHAQHYFVLCVDMRNRKLEIIDSLAESDRTSDIYGEILKDLVGAIVYTMGLLLCVHLAV